MVEIQNLIYAYGAHLIQDHDYLLKDYTLSFRKKGNTLKLSVISLKGEKEYYNLPYSDLHEQRITRLFIKDICEEINRKSSLKEEIIPHFHCKRKWFSKKAK